MDAGRGLVPDPAGGERWWNGRECLPVQRAGPGLTHVRRFSTYIGNVP